MNRCDFTRLTVTLLATATLATSAVAQVRNFPQNALRGQLEVLNPPDIRLNGEAARLSPGSRIRNTNNTIVFANSLRGQMVVVNYVREFNGLVHEVWILTPQEAALERPHEGTIRNFRFASELGQTPAFDTK